MNLPQTHFRFIYRTVLGCSRHFHNLFNWKSQWPIPKMKEFGWTGTSLSLYIRLKCGSMGNIWWMRAYISQSKLIGFAFVRLLSLRLALRPTRMVCAMRWVGQGRIGENHKRVRKRKENGKWKKWRLDWFSHCNLTLKHVVFVDWWCKLAFKPTPLLFHLNHTTASLCVAQYTLTHTCTMYTMRGCRAQMVLYACFWRSTSAGNEKKNGAVILANNEKEKSIYLLVFANKLGSCFT